MKLQLKWRELIFISVSHQTRFNTIIFFIVGFREGGRAQAETRALQDFAVHRVTMCNVSQMTPLDLDSLSAMWVRHVCQLIGWNRPGDLVLGCACQGLFVYSKVTRSMSGAVDLELPSGTNARRPRKNKTKEKRNIWAFQMKWKYFFKIWLFSYDLVLHICP